MPKGLRRYFFSRACIMDVRRGDAGKLQACLDSGADANWRTRHGPGLHLLDIAVQHGHLEIVHVLIAAGADPNTRNDDGSTPVHMAATVARPTVMAALLAAGGEADAGDDNGVTPLHKVAMFGIDDTSRGLRIEPDNSVVPGAAPAAELQDPAAVAEMLIEAGADPDREFRGVGTAVHLVAKRDALVPEDRRAPGLAEALLDALKRGGADIDRKTALLGEMAPIHAAVASGPDAIRMLLRAGADPDTPALHGATALHHAVMLHASRPGGCLAAIEALLEGGADPNARTWTGVQESSYRERAFRAAGDLDRQLAAEGETGELLDRMRSVWTEAVGGLTPLHLAAELGLADAIRALRRAGADPDLADENGRTPLAAAEANGDKAAAALRETLDKPPA